MGLGRRSSVGSQIAPSGDATGAADYAAITAAITAAHDAGGGQVLLGPFVGMTSSTFTSVLPVLMRSGVDVVGTSKSVMLKLANGANCDIVSVPNFDTLTGTGAASLDPASESSGPSRWTLRSLTIDGNRANQTGGIGVRIYGYNYAMEGLTIQNCYRDGLQTEYGSPSNTGLSALENRYNDLKIRYNGRHGWVHKGPTDCRADDITIEANRQDQTNATGIGLWIRGGGGLQIGKMHIWGLDFTHTWGLVADGSFFSSNLEVEGATYGQVLIRGGSTTMNGGAIYYLNGQSYLRGCGVQLGDDATTPGLLASGSSEVDEPATKTSFANACKIDTKISGFLGDDTRRAGFRWIRGQGCQVRATNFSYQIPTTTAHANSNGVDVSTWTGGSPGTLSLNKTGYAANSPHLSPNGGTATILTSTGTYTFTWTGMTGGSLYQNPEVLTGCVVQGSPGAGSLIATGATVAMTIATVGTKMVETSGYSTTHSDMAILSGNYAGVGYSIVGPSSTANYGGAFGDEGDGAAVLDGTATVAWATLTGGNTYTMTRDCFCSSITGPGGGAVTLVTNGYFIFGGSIVTGLTISGDGNAGNADGTAGAARLGTSIGNAGGAGNIAAGTAGPASTNAYAFGGFGGTGGAGSSGAGVAAVAPTVPNGAYAKRIGAISAGVLVQGGAPRALGGGAGGSGGTGDGTNKGGGGGAGANLVAIFARVISNVTVNTRGGNGGTPVAGNAGGGGGGGGGHVLTYSLALPVSLTTTRTGGIGGSGVGTGAAGTNGSAGNLYTSLVK